MAEGVGEEDVEADLFEFSAEVILGGDCTECFFEGVAAVAELFELCRGFWTYCFCAFFEDAEGFGEAFAGGGDDGGEGVALEFAVGFDGGADVVLGIAAKHCVIDMQRRKRGGEGVADVFEFGAEGLVVQGETGVVFHDAQGFAGAVGVGVEHA